jgi:hypothetical protein
MLVVLLLGMVHSWVICNYCQYGEIPISKREILPSACYFPFHKLQQKPKCSEANTAVTKVFIEFLCFRLSMKGKPLKDQVPRWLDSHESRGWLRRQGK